MLEGVLTELKTSITNTKQVNEREHQEEKDKPTDPKRGEREQSIIQDQLASEQVTLRGRDSRGGVKYPSDPQTKAGRGNHEDMAAPISVGHSAGRDKTTNKVKAQVGEMSKRQRKRAKKAHNKIIRNNAE